MWPVGAPVSVPLCQVLSLDPINHSPSGEGSHARGTLSDILWKISPKFTGSENLNAMESNAFARFKSFLPAIAPFVIVILYSVRIG